MRIDWDAERFVAAFVADMIHLGLKIAAPSIARKLALRLRRCHSFAVLNAFTIQLRRFAAFDAICIETRALIFNAYRRIFDLYIARLLTQ